MHEGQRRPFSRELSAVLVFEEALLFAVDAPAVFLAVEADAPRLLDALLPAGPEVR